MVNKGADFTKVNMSDQTYLIEKQAQRIEELEQELRIVKRQLQQFQGRQMDEIAERRRAAMQFYREEYERTHGATAYRSMAEETGGFDEVD